MAPLPLLAQGNGSTSGVLLEMPATSRQMAFQGAYTAVVGDEGSVFVNPAGMAPIKRTAVGLSYERGPFGTTLTTGSGVLRIGRFDFGIGLMYMDFGGDSVVVPDPAFGGDRGLATGQLTTAYNALAVGAVAYRRGMLSIGGSAKYLREEIGAGGGPAPYAANAVTGDVGLAIAVFDIMALGFTLQNVAGNLKSNDSSSYDLPRTMRFGYSLSIIDPQGTARLMATVDWVHPPGGDSYGAFGFEGGVVSQGVGIVGRAGVTAGRAQGDRKGFSLGAGLLLHSLRLDYAWQGYDVLGASHRFDVRWIP